MTSFLVKTDQFAGPFDTLLDLIEREKLDVGTMSLVDITDQFVLFVKTTPLPLETIGAFLVMASRLILLKSRALLPQCRGGCDFVEQEIENDLLVRLAYHKDLRALVTSLSARHHDGSCSFFRIQTPPPQKSLSAVVLPHGIGAEDLEGILKNVISSIPNIHHLATRAVVSTRSLNEEIELIIAHARVKNAAFSFHDMMQKFTDHTERIGSFLALLELVRCQRAFATQEHACEPIAVTINWEYT